MIGKKLSTKELFLDRVNRHGLYYAIKLIERNEPPRIIINSFWRSGSTFLLELLANSLKMRPYFEPLTPIEPKMSFLYHDLDFPFNLDRLHPVITEQHQVDLHNVLGSSKFSSKWVYQNANTRNFIASNGKIMKLVNGAHVLPHIGHSSLIIHLERDIFEVAESFLNSMWTKNFFKNVDLTYLCDVEDIQVSSFYAPFKEYLNISAYKLHEAVAIYKTLTDAYVERFTQNFIQISFAELKLKPNDIINRINDITGIPFEESVIEKYTQKPSRMTVFNEKKVKLDSNQKQEIRVLYEELKSRP